MKSIFKSLSFAAIFWSASLLLSAENGVRVDADFPGGNIIVSAVDGDTVRLRQDLRDTEGDWFYWAFRVRGAEGRTLDFEFHGGAVGARGPAVSTDGARTWRWLGEPGFSNRKFRYEFGPDEKEVFFAVSMLYTQRNLDRFLAKYGEHPDLNIGTLCKTKKGRNVERLRIAGTDKPKYKVFLSARNHCCEMMANYALEGVLEKTLSDDADGTWLRSNCDFFVVPLLDKDGVEDGDQGKNRKPHDHNRDYLKKIHPEVAAVTEQVPRWQGETPIFVLDMHCPWLRGGDDPEHVEKGTNEYVYFVGPESEDLAGKLRRFGTILEAERKGPVPYRESFNLPYGKSWNKASNVGTDMLKCSTWGGTLSNAVFASSIEIPYANACGVAVDAESAKALGRDLARAIRVYLETMPTVTP